MILAKCLVFLLDLGGERLILAEQLGEQPLAPKSWQCVEAAAHLGAHRRRLFCCSFILAFHISLLTIKSLLAFCLRCPLSRSQVAFVKL